MKLRLIKADALNWALQSWQEGGDTVERGRYAGQVKQSKWKPPHAFYSRLKDAARGLFNENLGDLPDGEPLTGAALIATIEAAETRTVEAVQAAVDTLETSMLIGVLQERGYAVTAGKKGRTSYVEEDETKTPHEDNDE